MKPLLIHGAWALLAAGAYLAGTRQSPQAASDDHSRAAAPGAGMNPAAAGKGSAAAARRALSEESAWLEAWRDGNGRISAERMKEAVTAAMQEPDPVKSLLNFTLLLQDLSAENAAAAVEAITENTGGREAGRFLSLLASAWGAKDGAGALTALRDLPRREGEMARATAMAAWAAAHPAAAKDWMVKASAGDSGAAVKPDRALERGLVTGLARRDVQEALQYVVTLDAGQQEDLAGVLVEQKLKEGVLTGAQWAESLPTEELRVTGMEVAGEHFLRRDLKGALQWAETIAARADAHEAVADIANELANRDPQRAVEWTAALPAGPSQNHAFEDVYENWTEEDPAAASQSLTNLAPGPGRDAAIEAFSGTLARENPTDALTWAGEIGDAKLRADTQVNLARRWFSSAPAEALSWIAGNLPMEVQTRALQPRR